MLKIIKIRPNYVGKPTILRRDYLVSPFEFAVRPIYVGEPVIVECFEPKFETFTAC